VRRCRPACLWLAPSAAPSTLPRTSLAASPPRPDLRISSSALALRRCPRISLQLAPSASPPALPRIRTSTCVAPNSSGLSLRLFLVRSFSGCRCCWACAQPSRSRLQDIALRPSLRLCLQTEFPLRACALRLRSTLRPPSGLRSTSNPNLAARAFVSCLPSSQPSGRLSQGFGSRLAPRSVVSPLAMPSSWNLRLLARTLRPVSLVFAQPLESSLQLAPSSSTPRHRSRGLFRSSLHLPCGLRLSSRSTPPAWTPGLSILRACALPDPPCG
jgi:hypothetical protein